MGAAYLAGLAVEYWKDPRDVAQNFKVQKKYIPQMSSKRRVSLREMEDGRGKGKGGGKRENRWKDILGRWIFNPFRPNPLQIRLNILVYFQVRATDT